MRATTDDMAAILDQLPTTRPGSELLQTGFHADGFVKAGDSDFTQIRQLSDLFKDE